MDPSILVLCGLALWVAGILLANLPVQCEHQRAEPCITCSAEAKRKAAEALEREHDTYHRLWGRNVSNCPYCKRKGE